MQNLHWFDPRGDGRSRARWTTTLDVIVSVGYRVKSLRGTRYSQPVGGARRVTRFGEYGVEAVDLADLPSLP